MALTRKMLKAMGIEDDKADQIIEEHISVVNSVKVERDTYKADAEKLPGLQQQLDEAKKKGSGSDEWKKKYEDLVAEAEAKKTLTAKTDAYRKLLTEAGVNEKYLDTVIRASAAEISKIEFDGDKVKGADDIAKAAKTAWADFIVKQKTDGIDTGNPPPGGTGGDDDLGNLSMADYIAARKKM